MPEFSMDQLVVSCRRAIDWLHRNLIRYNGDLDQLYVAGHSAGGHLAAMMMATDWQLFNQKLSSEAVKGICAISGLYNLLPLQLCYVNEILRMDKATALSNSPVQLLPQTNCALVLAVGADETAEYLSQSSELYSGWIKKQANLQLMEIPGRNHFSILETMLDNTSPLHKAICSLMNIA